MIVYEYIGHIEPSIDEIFHYFWDSCIYEFSEKEKNQILSEIKEIEVSTDPKEFCNWYNEQIDWAISQTQ